MKAPRLLVVKHNNLCSTGGLNDAPLSAQCSCCAFMWKNNKETGKSTWREEDRVGGSSTVFSYPEGMRVMVAPRWIKHCSRSPNQRALCKTKGSCAKRKQSRARKGTTDGKVVHIQPRQAKQERTLHPTRPNAKLPQYVTSVYRVLQASASSTRFEVMKCCSF